MGKLKEFLAKRERKRQSSFKMKANTIMCPDCKGVLFKGEKKITLCLCYGEHYGKDIKMHKTEDGNVKLDFPKKFTIDNIEMLHEAIKNK